MSKKYTYEYVRGYFIKQGCELLEKKYKNANAPMEYRCSCGNISKIRFNSFKQGSRCQICGRNKKFTLEYVKEYFKDFNCELLEKKYYSTHTPMKYRCSCGNISKISFNSFKQGSRCIKCKDKTVRHKLSFNFTYVKKYFKDFNCELLEKKYKNANTPMRYRCSCGNISKIRFKDFKNGKRCQRCKKEKLSGKNNWKYNPDLTDEEREKNRTRTSDCDYVRWRRSIFQKNKYTCQKCFQKGVYLNAHHIESWSTNKKLRLSKDNGITLCEKCHKKFHSKYGKGYNNKQQLDEFLNIY